MHQVSDSPGSAATQASRKRAVVGASFSCDAPSCDAPRSRCGAKPNSITAEAGSYKPVPANPSHPARRFHLPRLLQPALCALVTMLAVLASPQSHAAGAPPGITETVQYDTELASRADGADGVKGDFASGRGVLSPFSAEGRYVVFSSLASNLDPDDPDGGTAATAEDIYLRDRQTYDTELVSRASGADGDKANSPSQFPTVSADGRYVAFNSSATNLSVDDTDEATDVYVRDRQTGETILVSRANGADGANANAATTFPMISGNGRYVVFVSPATNLDPDDTDGTYDIFVRDLEASETILVSRASGIDGVKGNGFSYWPSISADGRYVAFFSSSTNLDPDAADAIGDIFVRDLETHVTILASRASGADGVKSNGFSSTTYISANGRYVTFSSGATNLDPADADTTTDRYLRDLQTSETILVSRASGADGTKGNGDSNDGSISNDGRYAAFSSRSSNLDPNDPDGDSDIYVRDLASSLTILVSRATGADGIKGNDASTLPALSSDGRFVSFASEATNLHPDDTDGTGDLYVRDLFGPTGKSHLDFVPASVDFGGVEVGTTSSPVTVTLSNTGDLEITGLTFDTPGNGFVADTSDCGSSLAPLESCDIVVTFTPPAFGAASATLTASNDQDASAALDLAGNGVGSPEAVLAFDPTDLDFGDITVGTTSDPLVATLHNTGTGAASALTYTAPNAFALDTSACGTSIGAGQSCDVAITFTPMSGGAVDAHLLLDSHEGISATLGLHGTGIIPPAPLLAFTPENFAFGEVEVGASSAPQVATLHNSGDGDATGLSFNTPGSGFLADTANCGSILAAGASCTVSVVFTPDSTGGSAATLEASSSEGASAVLGTRTPPEKYLYFLNKRYHGIFRVDPADFQGARPLFTGDGPEGGTAALAVDTQNCAYYFTTDNELRRANIDGTDERIINSWTFEAPELAFDAESGTLYFTHGLVEGGDPMSWKIFRAHAGPDGLTDVMEVLSTPDFNGQVHLPIRSLALDVAANRIYWTAGQGTNDSNVGGVWSARLDGTDIQLIRDTTFELPSTARIGNPYPVGIALDLQNGKVYWGDYESIEDGENNVVRPAGIYRTNLDGSGYEVFLENPPGFGQSIAVDPDAGKVYWGGVLGLHRANLDGSGIEPAGGFDSGGFRGLGFIAGDIDARCHIPKADICPANADCSRQEMIYWTAGGPSADDGKDLIWRARADGSHVEPLIVSLDDVAGLAVSRELGKVYWTETGNYQGASTSTTSVYRANLDGTDAEQVLSLPFDHSGDYVQDIALDEPAGKLFVVQAKRDGFSGQDRTKLTLWRADLDGGHLEVRAIFDYPQIPSGTIAPSGLSPRLDKNARTGYMSGADRIYRFDLDDTTSAPVEVVPPLPSALYPEGGPWLVLSSPHALQLDPIAGKIYWRQAFLLDGTGAPAKSTRNYRANLDGSSIELAPWPINEDEYDQERSPNALDPYSSRMYGLLKGPVVSRWEIDGGEDLGLILTRSSFTGVGGGLVPLGKVALLPTVSGGTAEETWATLGLSGEGVARELTVTPDTLDFGEVPLDDVAGVRTVTLASTGTTAVAVDSIGDAIAPFVRVGGTCPAIPFVLDAGAACQLDYRFEPDALGPVQQVVNVTGNATGVSFTLAGEGVAVPPRISLAPASLDFSVASGDSAADDLDVTNTGAGTLTWNIGTAGPDGTDMPTWRDAIATPVTAAFATGTGRTIAATGNLVALTDVTMSQTADTNIVPANSAACPTGPNHLLRRFYFNEHPGVTDPATIGSVDIAIQEADTEQTLTVNLYALPRTAPVDTIPEDALIPIGSASVTISPANDGGIVNVPVSGTVGNTHLYDLVVEASADVFFIGATNTGETHPGFIVAPACGASVPTPINTLVSTPTHIIMVVHADGEGGPVACDNPSTIPWLNVSPSSGSTQAGETDNAAVTADAAGLEPGDYAANLCVTSNDPGHPLIEVPVALTVTPGPSVVLAFDPTSIDFGEVDMGSTSAPQAIALENTGVADATGLMFDVSSTDFVADASNCGDTLAAGATCSIAVTFSPSATGPASATLTASSNEGASAWIDLAGNGVESPDADLGVAIAATHDALQPGHMADYLVTLDNGGPATAAGADIASLLSPQLDLDFASWLCVGPASSGCTPVGQGDLAETGLEVPAGGSVTWLLSAPVRWDAQGPVETSATATYPDDPNPANNSAVATNPVVVYRNGFEQYGMGSEILMMLDEQLTPAVVLTLDWSAPGNTGTVETVFAAAPLPGAANASDAAFRLERFGAGPLSWVRLVAIDDRGAEISGHWLPVTPGTELTLALADTLVGNGAEGDGGGVAGDGNVDGNGGEAADGGDADGSEVQKLRSVLLMARGGDRQLPLATTPDAYRLWSALPVTVTPLGN